jgi:hypothetical protein
MKHFSRLWVFSIVCEKEAFDLICRIAVHQCIGILIVPEQTVKHVGLRKYRVVICEQDYK